MRPRNLSLIKNPPDNFKLCIFTFKDNKKSKTLLQDFFDKYNIECRCIVAIYCNLGNWPLKVLEPLKYFLLCVWAHEIVNVLINSRLVLHTKCRNHKEITSSWLSDVGDDDFFLINRILPLRYEAFMEYKHFYLK